MNLTTLIVFLICFACFAGIFIYILIKLERIETLLSELTEEETEYKMTEDLNREIDEILDKEEISKEINEILDN